ncbi:hypothetical protein [Glutamicibacter sp. TV12E]|uniref:hypothetical protein n=1 Tax=Glutamicibacter sp. TV12E TaxID=3446362 RepID=UPI0040344A2F
MQHSSRSARVLRGMVVAFCVTAVSLLSHVLAGGPVPGLLNVALPLSLSVLLCILLGGRHLTLIRLIIMVAASQMLFHLTFSMGSGHASMVEPGPGSHGAHDMSMILDLPQASAMPVAQHSGTSMVVAHVMAGIATVYFVHRGDELLAVLAGLGAIFTWTRFWVLLAYSCQPAAPQATVLGWEEPRTFIMSVYHSSVIRRGPPAVATA